MIKHVTSLIKERELVNIPHLWGEEKEEPVLLTLYKCQHRSKSQHKLDDVCPLYTVQGWIVYLFQRRKYPSLAKYYLYTLPAAQPLATCLEASLGFMRIPWSIIPQISIPEGGVLCQLSVDLSRALQWGLLRAPGSLEVVDNVCLLHGMSWRIYRLLYTQCVLL